MTRLLHRIARWLTGYRYRWLAAEYEDGLTDVHFARTRYIGGTLPPPTPSPRAYLSPTTHTPGHPPPD